MDRLPDAFDLMSWIDANRGALKPPTAGQTILKNDKYMVTIVGGPNARTDFHVNQGAEFFYQLEGTMTLRIQEQGAPRDISISAGNIYLLAPGTPHAPQRPANTVGLILESTRQPGELDTHQWYCDACNNMLFEKTAHLEIMERDMPLVFEAYYEDPANQHCDSCGHDNPGRPKA